VIDEEMYNALLSVRGQHYDLVANGWELGGGSIRVHDAALQESIMRTALSLPEAQIEGFSHLLEALKLGSESDSTHFG
jgi:aspartyl-tRNA synthetase